MTSGREKALTKKIEYFFTVAWGCPSGVMDKMMDYEIVLSKFELESRYYVQFRANTLEKGMNPLVLPAMVK